VSFAAITLCAASERVFIVVSVYFVIDSVRKLWDTHSYVCVCNKWTSLSVWYVKSQRNHLENMFSRNIPFLFTESFQPE
jgi:hypothetical protein